jgi:hypothetical protein
MTTVNRVHGVKRLRSLWLGPLITLALIVLGSEIGGAAEFELKSITFPVLYRGYLANPIYASQVEASLDELASTGANDVIVAIRLYMTDRFSSNVLERPDLTEDLPQLEQLVRSLSRRGLGVSFKPAIGFLASGDANVAAPTDIAQWFATYKQMLLKYASFGESLGVRTLYLGNELNPSLMAPQHRSTWLDIISAVRGVFHGALSVNVTIHNAGPYSIPAVPFADQLDFVGVSFYVPRYTDVESPTVDQLAAAWHLNADHVDLVTYLKSISDAHGKPVAISEIAYRSVRGYNSKADDAGLQGQVDYQEQANLYEAFFRVWNQPGRPWFKGVSFWGWFAEHRPSSATSSAVWYAEQGSSVQVKPAQAVLTKGFEGALLRTTLAAAILPSSRAVQVDGSVATAFLTLVNAGPSSAFGVGISTGLPIPAAFSYQSTDCATNTPTGSADILAFIAFGDKRCFLIAIKPMATFDPVDLPFVFSGANVEVVPVLQGINTLLVSASMVAGPDVIALAATPSNDGVAAILGARGAGVFAVATANVGASGPITVSADTGAASVPVTLSLCQTDPVIGTCLAPPSGTVSTTIGAHTTPTFGVFLRASELVPFDPANARVFVRFKDTNAVVRGSTSVAITTRYVVGTSGQVELVSPPPSVELAALESSTRARVFPERIGVALDSAVSVNITASGLVDSVTALTPGVISPGQQVDSFYIHTDPVGGSFAVFEGSVTFGTEILGVIILNAELNASHATLGATGTLYPSDAKLELSSTEDTLLVSADRRTLTFRVQSGVAIDAIRVVTKTMVQ